VRWMCSWDTKPNDIDLFVADIEKAMAG